MPRSLEGKVALITGGSSGIGRVAALAFGMRGGPAYSASKGGVVQLTRTAALEYAKAGIRVNAVCPGFVATPMTEEHTRTSPDLEAWIKRIQPMGRLATPEEVAEAVVWLCS